MQMIINSAEIYRYWTSEMRVGLFLLLSGVVHLAAGQWLDWRTPPRLSGPPALAQAVALPQLVRVAPPALPTEAPPEPEPEPEVKPQVADRKSTRLNSSHVRISYAVFCLKKKKKT